MCLKILKSGRNKLVNMVEAVHAETKERSEDELTETAKSSACTIKGEFRTWP